MSVQLVQKLEEKVDQALETIGMLRLELEEMGESQERLKSENKELKTRQSEWEQSLASLLRKLSNTDLSSGLSGTVNTTSRSQTTIEQVYEEEMAT